MLLIRVGVPPLFSTVDYPINKSENLLFLMTSPSPPLVEIRTGNSHSCKYEGVLKKIKFSIIFILTILLGSVSLWVTACGNNKSPTSSGSLTPTATPVNSQTIWANGNTGYFFGQ